MCPVCRQPVTVLEPAVGEVHSWVFIPLGQVSPAAEDLRETLLILGAYRALLLQHWAAEDQCGLTGTSHFIIPEEKGPNISTKKLDNSYSPRREARLVAWVREAVDDVLDQLS